jgi:hypothetical protein
MKVKIVKYSGINYWYIQNVGEVFDVNPEPYEINWYVVNEDNGEPSESAIRIVDCCIVDCCVVYSCVKHYFITNRKQNQIH